MVPLIRFKSFRKIIIKIFLVSNLGFLVTFNSFSNPISFPVIMEIYFNSGDWRIELQIDESFGISSLDNIRLAGLYDTAQFLPGFEFTPNEVFYITQAELQTDFFMNQSGDVIMIQEYDGYGYWWTMDGMAFGEVPPDYYYSDVSAPVGEESIALQMFTDPYSYDFWWTVKELPNSIGFSPGEVLKRAEFSGYVKDQNYEPLEGIELAYCPDFMHYYTNPTVPYVITGQDGYFHTDNMFCKKYQISFILNSDELADTVIFIEPDSANYFEFVLDTLLMGVNEADPLQSEYSITNNPNPFSQSTIFIINSENSNTGQKGVIKIFSSEGYIVDIIPVLISQGAQEVRYELSNNKLSSGVYFYNLEIGHKEMASRKMLIIR